MTIKLTPPLELVGYPCWISPPSASLPRFPRLYVNPFNLWVLLVSSVQHRFYCISHSAPAFLHLYMFYNYPHSGSHSLEGWCQTAFIFVALKCLIWWLGYRGLTCIWKPKEGMVHSSRHYHGDNCIEAEVWVLSGVSTEDWFSSESQICWVPEWWWLYGGFIGICVGSGSIITNTNKIHPR